MLNKTNFIFQPDGNIYPILSEIVGEGAFDLFIEDTKGRRKSTEEDKQALQELTYVVENLTYYITDIMVRIIYCHIKVYVKIFL